MAVGECSVCGNLTDWACSDCYMESDCTKTVYVCNGKECRDEHEKTCPGKDRQV